MRKVTRRFTIGGGLAMAAGAAWWRFSRSPPIGMELSDGEVLRATELLLEQPVVDIHSHAGRTFLSGAQPESLLIRLMRDGFEDERIAEMQRASISAGLFSIVADFAVLGIENNALKAVRPFEENEAWTDFRRQLFALKSAVDQSSISLALTADDIRLAHVNRTVVAVIACEGGDFIEDRPERLTDAWNAGVRSLSLMHYNNNRLGDIQTGPAVHGGLTDIGREVVHEMNRLGMIVDAAHASFDTCTGLVAESSLPVMLSHSNLQGPASQSARLLSPEHAQLIADKGGIIGAWPSGIGSKTLADFAEQIIALVDTVGARHVAIGTDMDANYKPVLTSYTDFPLLVAILLRKGMKAADIGAVLGGNFLEFFDAVQSAKIPVRSNSTINADSRH